MIAQMCLSPAWGGLEMTALKLTQQFADAGKQSCCFCLKGSPLQRELEKKNLMHFPVPSGFEYFSVERSLLIKKIVAQQKVKVIFHHRLKDLWLTALARKFGMVVKEHGFAHMMLNNVRKKGLLHRWIYSNIEKLIVMTPSQKRNLLKALPVSNEDYFIVPNGIDLKKFTPENKQRLLRQEYSISDDVVCIGLVGRIDPQKGHREALEALGTLNKKFSNRQFKLIFVGEETIGEDSKIISFKSTLDEMAMRLGIEADVIFAGHRTNMHELYSSFDIFIMPSYEETFGYVLIEAMATEVPVIATAAGGPMDIVDPGTNGLLVEPKSSSELSDAIGRLVSEEGLSKQLALAGRIKAETIYDQNKVFAAVESLTH